MAESNHNSKMVEELSTILSNASGGTKRRFVDNINDDNSRTETESANSIRRKKTSSVEKERQESSIPIAAYPTENGPPLPKKNPRLEFDIAGNAPEKHDGQIKPAKPTVKSGGLSSLVGTLKGTKKQSMLEKSAQDWRQFVEQEDIEEELNTHLRSRNAYLDKQDFLRRADYSQFEKERDLRAHERKAQQQQRKKD